MKVVKSVEELETALKPVMKNMVDQLSKQVYETLNYFLNNYYTGWTPKVYQRTQDFLHSAVRVKAKEYKGRIQGYVYIDYQNMDNYVDVTGFQVATWANEGLHGGISVRHKPHVWDDTMRYTIDNGSLLKNAVSFLRSKGYRISK